jgi:hypothetical protein
MKQEIMRVLDEMFPNPQCELNFSNRYELLVSVMLSAQTTDKSVNKVNKTLFNKYPNLESLKDANIGDVIEIIKPIGLANSKAKNIIMMAKMVCEKYHGDIPSTKEELVKLAGVGVKTANVEYMGFISDYLLKSSDYALINQVIAPPLKEKGLPTYLRSLDREGIFYETFDQINTMKNKVINLGTLVDPSPVRKGTIPANDYINAYTQLFSSFENMRAYFYPTAEDTPEKE